MLLPTLLFGALLAAGPRISSLEARLDGGAGTNLTRADPTRFGSTGLIVGLALSDAFDLHLSYGYSGHERRSGAHVGGVAGRLQLGDPFTVEGSLTASPLGRDQTSTLCFGEGDRMACAPTEERMGFVTPGVSFSAQTNPDRALAFSAETGADVTWFRLAYRAEGGSARQVRMSETRLGVGMELVFARFLGLGARGDYFLNGGVDLAELPRVDPRVPAEQPLAPRKYEVGPTLSFAFGHVLTARLYGAYSPYLNTANGFTRIGELQLTADAGSVQFHGKLAYQDDVAGGPLKSYVPRVGAGKYEAVRRLTSIPEYVSVSAGVGVSVSF